MNRDRTLMFLAGFLLLVVSPVLLSGCIGSTSQDSRIIKLEDGLKANKDAIAKLQQQVDALKPAPAPVSPPAATTPAPAAPAPAPAPAPAAPNPGGLLASANVLMDKLTLTPAQINIGGTVTMSIAVTNNSSKEGKYKVVLTEQMVSPRTATDVLEYANLITLKAGETQTVTFTATKNDAGTFLVKAGAKSAQYAVIDPNAEPAP